MNFKNTSILISNQPKEIKEIIFSNRVFGLLEDIAIEEKLSEEQFLILNDETSYVLLGVNSVDSFDFSLNALNIDVEKKKRIVSKVRDNIFEPVISILNKSHQSKDLTNDVITKTAPIIDKVKSSNNESPVLQFSKNISQNTVNEQNLKQRIEPKLNKDKKSMLIQWYEKFFINYPTFSQSKSEKEVVAKKIKSGVTQKSDGGFPDYYNALPLLVKDLIFDGAWKSRTEEISRKYTLNPSQSDTLSNNVLFVLIGIDKPENFLKLMTSELGISKLLSDQIIEDLEIRVFEYALKTVEKAEERRVVNSQQTVVKDEPRVPLEIKIPEIRPVTLPMVEKGEVAHNVPTPQKPPATPPYKPVFSEKVVEVVKQEPVKEKSAIIYSSKQNNGEMVQKPLSVPRFSGVRDDKIIVDENAAIPKTNIAPISTIDQKLNSQNPSKTTLPPNEPKENSTPIAKSYVVDPYREGIE